MSERIYTKCPACHNDTLIVNEDKHLLCTWIGCENPTLIANIDSALQGAESEWAGEMHRREALWDEERDALRAERDNLKQWKESAMAVESEWDEQAVAKMVGAKLGKSAKAEIARRVPEMLAELEVMTKNEMRSSAAMTTPLYRSEP